MYSPAHTRSAAFRIEPGTGRRRHREPREPRATARLFPLLTPLVVTDEAALDLARAMTAGGEGDRGACANPQIPAGVTFVLQFMAHDLTLGRSGAAAAVPAPGCIDRARTPALDLACLYAGTPDDRPDLYRRELRRPYGPSNYFLLGLTAPSTGQNIRDPLSNDLPRNRLGTTIAADPRNDANLVLAQLHVALLKFHNAVVDHLASTRPELRGPDQFREARRIVTWHYQWAVLFDVVGRLVEPAAMAQIRHFSRRFPTWEHVPALPAEFLGTLLHIHHATVQGAYDINRICRQGGQFGPATLADLFGFTGGGGAIVGDLRDEEGVEDTPAVPGGKLKALPGNRVIDWRRFFELGPRPVPNPSRRIETRLSPTLWAADDDPEGDAGLALQLLRQGVRLGLPSGQDVARFLGVRVLSAEEIATGPAGEVARARGIDGHTPLWFYILREAAVIADGERLGPVGSVILAETVLGVLERDPASFLAARTDWQPELPAAVPETFTIADLLRFVDDINPIGGACHALEKG